MVMRKHVRIVCTVDFGGLLTCIGFAFPFPRAYENLFHYVEEKAITPFNQIHEVFILADRLKESELNEPDMDWVPHTGKTKLKIKGQIVGLDDIRAAISTLLRDANDLLKTEIFKGFVSEDIAFKDLKDDLSECVLHYSFSRDDRNSVLKLQRESLARHLIGEGSAHRTVMLESPSWGERAPRWNYGGITGWLNRTSELLDMLLVLIHLTSGQPARGTELQQYLLTNTENAGRNLFVCKDTLMLVQEYSKTGSMIGRDLAIARFLPPAVAQLLLKYVSIVRPLER